MDPRRLHPLTIAHSSAQKGLSFVSYDWRVNPAYHRSGPDMVFTKIGMRSLRTGLQIAMPLGCTNLQISRLPHKQPCRSTYRISEGPFYYENASYLHRGFTLKLYRVPLNRIQ